MRNLNNVATGKHIMVRNPSPLGIPHQMIMALMLTLALATPTTCFAFTDFWGTKLKNAPTQFVFGYGSLINSPSRNSTVGSAIQAIPARVSATFGYQRTWSERSPSGFTALGLRKVGPNETAQTINGVIFPIDADGISKFDAREKGYVRIELQLNLVEAAGWQRLPERGQLWIYVPDQSGSKTGDDRPGPDPSFPLLQSYIDVVIEGGLEYGEDFARELLETTEGWSAYWLNDRILARRPWVMNVKADAVDRLILSTAPASASFAERRFPESYAARWLMQPAK